MQNKYALIFLLSLLLILMTKPDEMQEMPENKVSPVFILLTEEKAQSLTAIVEPEKTAKIEKIWQPGDTWQGIAIEYGIDLKTLQSLNARYIGVPASEMNGKTISLPANAKRRASVMAFDFSCVIESEKMQRINSRRSNGFEWPVDLPYRYISGYAYQPGFHEAVDLGAAMRSPIYAAAEGIVAKAEYDSRYGYHVQINHPEGRGTHYAHLDSLLVSCGDYVLSGQVIGYSGSTGLSSGPHLHFGIAINGQWIDPLTVLELK